VAPKGRATRGPDDGKRGDFGLAISIVMRPKGRAHLVFDDVQRVGTGQPAQWSTNSFFTSVDFNLTDLIEVQLDDQDFVTIGLAVAARLAAQYKARRPSNKRNQFIDGCSAIPAAQGIDGAQVNHDLGSLKPCAYRSHRACPT
jgi:hypothetical protein